MINTSILLLTAFLLAMLTMLRQTDKMTGGGDNTCLLNRDFTNSLRGVAMLFIIIGHISGTMHTVVFSPIAGIGVTLFLFVSGYGLNCSFKNQGLKNFWKKKVKRVLIPYFFVIVVLRYFRYDFQPVDFLLDILGLDTTYWFVEFIVYWYIIFYVTSRWLKKYRIVAMTVVAVFMFFFLESGLEKNQVFSFVIGVMASVYYERVYSITRRQWIVIGLSAFFWALYC